MSEKYLGGIECVRALMAPAKQTINDKVVVPSSSDVQLRCNLILEETLEFLEACLGKTDDFFEYLSAIRFAADGIRNTKTEIVDVDLEEAFASKIPDYKDTIKQVGQLLVLFEVKFDTATVTLDLENIDTIALV